MPSDDGRAVLAARACVCVCERERAAYRVLVPAVDLRVGREARDHPVQGSVHLLGVALEEASAAADEERVAREQRAFGAADDVVQDVSACVTRRLVDLDAYAVVDIKHVAVAHLAGNVRTAVALAADDGEGGVVPAQPAVAARVVAVVVRRQRCREHPSALATVSIIAIQ